MIGVTKDNAHLYKEILCKLCLPIEEGHLIFLKRCPVCNLLRACKHNYKISNSKCCSCDIEKFFVNRSSPIPIIKKNQSPVYPNYFKPKFVFGDL